MTSQSGSTAVAEEPRSARREATRERVLDAARVVFAERGVNGATIEDIVEQAGFTRGAVYSNFADKNAVLLALIEREHERLLRYLDGSFDLIDREISQAEDIPAAVNSIVDQVLRTLPVDRELSLIQAELEIHAIRRPDVAAAFVSANKRFRARLGDAIVLVMQRHGWAPAVSTTDLVDTIVAVVERSARRALLEQPAGDTEALSAAVLPRILLALAGRVAPA